MLLLFLLLGCAANSVACSCVDNSVSLANRICSSEEADELVLEVVVVDQPDAHSSLVRVDRQLVGRTDKRELTLLNGSGSMCSFSIDGAANGSRYLLFAAPDQVEAGSLLLFTCGSLSNLYAMNRMGTEIAYGVAPQVGGRTFPLSYKPFDREVLRNDCSITTGELASYSRFANLRLYANPGDGRIRFDVASGEFPPLSMMRVFSLLGQELAAFSLAEYQAGAELNLTDLPRGVLLVEVSDGVFRRTFRYLRTR